MYRNIVQKFTSFRRIPLQVIIVTALASYVLQLGAIVQGLPLYLIALFTTLPWIPLAVFESTWKIKHYNWIAVFAVVTALQIGHLGEHVVQIVQLYALNGVISQACPPPKDNPTNAIRGEDLGIRPPGIEPTGGFGETIVVPNANGTFDDSENRGPAACGVFGALDAEYVHLVWDSLVWIGGLFLLYRFPGNIWLWLSVLAASIHQVEHLFLGFIFQFQGPPEFAFTRQLWATTLEGNRVIAFPAGQEMEAASFYEASGVIGVMGQNGMVERLIGSQDVFPQRAPLPLRLQHLRRDTDRDCLPGAGAPRLRRIPGRGVA